MKKVQMPKPKKATRESQLASRVSMPALRIRAVLLATLGSGLSGCLPDTGAAGTAPGTEASAGDSSKLFIRQLVRGWKHNVHIVLCALMESYLVICRNVESEFLFERTWAILQQCRAKFRVCGSFRYDLLLESFVLLVAHEFPFLSLLSINPDASLKCKINPGSEEVKSQISFKGGNNQ
jgi:hypothetical protein